MERDGYKKEFIGRAAEKNTVPQPNRMLHSTGGRHTWIRRAFDDANQQRWTYQTDNHRQLSVVPAQVFSTSGSHVCSACHPSCLLIFDRLYKQQQKRSW